ncbi:MAG: Gfo/Idh/MocA family oxidoreductase [Magnetococcales bacterium]|nr:Gfo/Idh/MocA family oxidoreductase [Magnetococcales bacterium]
MKVIVVGAGSIGFRHLSNLLALRSAGRLPMPIDTVVVAEPHPATRERVRESFADQPVTSVETLSQADAAAGDAVLICTPAHYHVAQALQCVERGCHLFIEKPLAITLDKSDTLVRQVEERGVTALVACNMWFHPAIREINTRLASGAIGQPRLFRSYWGHHVSQWNPGASLKGHYSLDPDQGGGSLFDVGAHEFFFVPQLLGAIREASCDCGPSGVFDSAVDDFSHTVSALETGVRGTFSFNFLDRCRRRSLEVIGDEGSILWNSEGKQPIRERLRIHPGNGEWTEIPVTPIADTMYEATLQHFFNAIHGTESVIQSVAQARETLALILALRQTGRYTSTPSPR